MPATVFPAPGSPTGTQFLAPLGAFDIAPRGGGVFKNLLLWSQDLYQSPWSATNITIAATASTTLSTGGTSGTNNFVVTSATGIAINQRVTGTGLAAGTYVIAIAGTTVYLSSRFTTTGSGTYNFYNPAGFNTATSTSNTQALGQTVTVIANTAYVFSFYAKKGTATAATYNIFNNTASSNIIADTSYYSSIDINFTTTATGSISSTTITVASAAGLYIGLSVTAATGITLGTRIIGISGTTITLSAANTGAVSGSITFSDTNWQRITVPFTTPVGCTSVIVRPLSTLSSGFGTTLLTGLQLERGSTATPYEVTLGSSPAAQGLTPPSIDYAIVPKIQQRRELTSIVDNRRFVAKIQQRRELTSIVDNRRFVAKIQQRRELTSVADDRRFVAKIQKFFLPDSRIGITISDIKDFGKLRPYDPDLPTADYRIPITGQSLDPSTPTFSIDTIFLQQNADGGYIWVDNTPPSAATKTLYFANQRSLRFDVGSTMRITNANLGYSVLVVVTACTFTSVSYTGADLPPEISGTFVETGATLYPQTSVRTTSAPANAREIFYYSRISPGLFSNSTINRGIIPQEVSDNRKDTSSLTKSIIKYINIVNNLEKITNLSKFDPGNQPSDFSIQILGQSLDPSTPTFSTNSIFLEQNADDGYLWTETVPSSVVVKTLYFTNQRSIRFEVGSIIRIRNINSNYSATAIVTACTFTSVSYTGADLPPEISGTFVDSGSTLYPRLSVNTTIAPTNARENLYYATLAPGLFSNSTINQGRTYASFESTIQSLGRTLSVNTIKGISNDSNLSNVIQLSRFDPGIVTPDISIPITGQNLDSTTGVYSADTMFLEQSTDGGYIWTDSTSIATTKTLYFARQNIIPFAVGSTMRIRNANNGYSTNVIVTDCTTRSVSYTGADLPVETSGTFVETGFTLYPQRLVTTTTAPINARENLYYSVIAPGERSNRAWGVGPYFAADTANEILKNYQIEKPITKIISGDSDLNFARLLSMSVLRSDPVIFDIDFIEPVKFNNNVIFDLSTPYVEKLLAAIVAREASTTIRLDALKAINVLRSDPVIFDIDFIEPVKFNNNVIFDFASVYVENLEKQIAKLANGDPLDLVVENLEKQIAKLANGDPLRFIIEKLAAATVLREDRIRFSTENLSKQLQRLFADNAIIETGSSKLKAINVLIEVKDGFLSVGGTLQKQLDRLKSDTIILNSGKLRDVSPLKDTAAQIFDVEPRLETFDNIGIYNEITSRIIGSSTLISDIVNYYLYDQDIMGLKVITSAETQILTYSNFEYPQINKYPPGTRVQLIDSATGAIYITQVLASTSNTITIPFILGFPSTTQYGTISSQIGPSVYPREQVRPTTKPANARERLYYAELIPTLYTPRNVEFSPVYPVVPPDSLLAVDALEKLKAYNFIAIESNSEGKIQIMKTGDFKRGSVGIQDPAYVKKEPIQFWN